jgi:HSP20 family protein
MMRTLLPRVGRPLEFLVPEWNQAFESFFGADPFREVLDLLAGPSEREPFPAVTDLMALDAWETPTALHIEVDLPGVAAADVDVQVHGGELTLKVERRNAALDGERWMRRERGAGNFTRTLALPVEVDSNAVEAELAQGVLRLRLPKAERAQPRAIPIKTPNN